MPRAALLALLLATAAFADWPVERDTFLAAWNSEAASDRIAAARALKEFDHPDGMRLILECYAGERDSDVRQSLADLMNAATSVKSRDVFRETILKHPDAAIRARFCAVFADARMLDRFDMLRSLMRDSAAVVRARALRNLGDPDDALAADVARLVADPEVDVRMAACSAAGAIKVHEPVPALLHVLDKDPVGEVRWAATDALQKISGEQMGEDRTAWKKWWDGQLAQVLPKVDLAIKRGADWLKAQVALQLAVGAANPNAHVNANDRELAIYALVHAGVPVSDDVMRAGVDHLLRMPLTSTYHVSVAAMALSDLDPVAYRERLAHIAQWLVDTQCISGQWSYGGNPPKMTPTKKTEKKTPSNPNGGAAPPPEPIKIAWRDTIGRAPGGDNSNTQYALLGLRATLAAGCEIPKGVWERSLVFFRKAQCKDGGWDYGTGGPAGAGSMTVGALSSIVICMRALKMDDQLQEARLPSVKDLARGMEWVEKNWTVEKNPPFGYYHFYYLYGLERAGMILGVKKFGEHDWYAEGSEYLLAAQKDEGMWSKESPMWDTCFAILFLKRATKGYTVSGGR